MSPLWRLVFGLVGLLTLNSLNLDFVWLLSVTYNSQMKKGDLMVLVVFQHNHQLTWVVELVKSINSELKLP